MSKGWKEAASLIILGRSFIQSSNLKSKVSELSASSSVDYKILAVKRAAKSSFMPNGYVFPGGMYDEADASLDWLELYRHTNIGSITDTYPFEREKDTTKIKCRFNNVLTCDKSNSYLSKALSFRITAIRELFEECGLLLVKNSKIHRNKDCFNSEWASYLHSNDILKWQERVQKNPQEFIKLCQHFECIPDVWSLKDWAVWLTPVHLPTKRFDTTFFVASIDHIPPTNIDRKEISDMKWSTPDDLLEKHLMRSIWLPPPQFYELSRITANFKKIQHFVDYSSSWYGCKRWMPVGIKADDGWVYLLPGDDMYPKVPDLLNSSGDKEKRKKEEKTSEHGIKMIDLRKEHSRMHRIEVQSPHDLRIIINCCPTEDHIYPKL